MWIQFLRQPDAKIGHEEEERRSGERHSSDAGRAGMRANPPRQHPGGRKRAPRKRNSRVPPERDVACRDDHQGQQDRPSFREVRPPEERNCDEGSGIPGMGHQASDDAKQQQAVDQ